MTLIKFITLASCASQFVGLVLASRIDLKASAISKAESELPDEMFLRIYQSERDGRRDVPSDEEATFHALLQEDDKRNSVVVN